MEHDDPGLTPKDAQALDAAKLYYSGLAQREVAERLHVSRSTVSKLLAHAEHRGFVRIEVYDPRERDPPPPRHPHRALLPARRAPCQPRWRRAGPVEAGPRPRGRRAPGRARA